MSEYPPVARCRRAGCRVPRNAQVRSPAWPRPPARRPRRQLPRPRRSPASSRQLPPATSYAVERATLRNGLRVVLAPDRSAPVVGRRRLLRRRHPVRARGAHRLRAPLRAPDVPGLGVAGEDGARPATSQSSGGILNGSTRLDYTNYYEALPSNALERALFLEADRMRSPAVTEENLANQIAVVKEEIRVNVLNQPYGGFPWLTLPPVLFETFPNAHDGYGGFEDLESATVEDARDFFDRYYAPGNAVLACRRRPRPGRRPWRWSHRHFGDVPRRTVPARPDFDEPAPTSERRAEHVDPLAPAPAVALGWRVPDPDDLDAYLPYVVLTSRARHRRRLAAAPPPRAGGPGRHRRRRPRRLHGGRVRRAQPHGPARRGAPRGRRAPPTGSSRPSTRSSTGSRPTASRPTSSSGSGPG